MPWHLIAECIVVDNGSTDATAVNASAAGARVITAPAATAPPASPGQTPRSQPAPSSSTSTATAPTTSPSSIRLIDPILANTADFTIGSRIRGRREPGSMLPAQIFAAHLVGTLLRFIPSVRRRARYTDMGAFRAIRRSCLNQLQMSELTYGWNLEMQIKAAQHNLRILELPVDYRNRIGGESKVAGNFRASIKAGIRIFEVLFRVGLSRRN